MLRTNLAARPFYNERIVRALLVALAAVAVGLSIYTAGEFISLGARNRSLDSQAAAAEQRARELRAEAAKVRQSVSRADLDKVAAAAREANVLIDRRAFSWTALFNRFEETLPADVRITAVQPQVSNDGRLVIAMTALSRRVEELDTFIDRLEKTGAFGSTLSREEQVEEDGTIRSIIQGFYGASAGDPRPASKAGGAGTPPPPTTASGAGEGR
jgi:Tfp pilus assembly protein PilN